MDWERYEKIGKFFTRKKGDKLGDGVADDDFYGIAYQAGKGYDFSTMQVNSMVWQFGGDIWDETGRKPAKGVVNSDIAVSAMQRYLDLLKYMPPVAKTGQMDIFVIQDLYMQGKVASIIDWVGVMGTGDQPEGQQSGRQGRVRADARPAQAGRLDQPLLQPRRPALRADDVEQRRGGARVARRGEVVAVEGHADQVRQERRPECEPERARHARST